MLDILYCGVHTVLMPQVTVFVRDEDLSKWKAIDKKALFLHNALNKVSEAEIVPHPLRSKVVIKDKKPVEIKKVDPLEVALSPEPSLRDRMGLNL